MIIELPLCPRCEKQLINGQRVKGVRYGEQATLVHVHCAARDDVITTDGTLRMFLEVIPDEH